MIINCSWLPVSYYRHELNVLGWIQDKGSTLKTNFAPNLPIPIGMIAEYPGAWYTTGGRLCNSTIATYCLPESHLGQVVYSPSDHLRVYRDLFQTLKYFAQVGVNYRNLNSGNVLRTADGECLLTDFGNARIPANPRGPESQTLEDQMATSLDDSRSGTLTFFSRRIHRLAVQMDVRREVIRKRDKAQLEVSNPARKVMAERAAKRVLKMDRVVSDIRMHHCYIDDAESALYLMLFEVSLHKPLLCLNFEWLWLTAVPPGLPAGSESMSRTG